MSTPHYFYEKMLVRTIKCHSLIANFQKVVRTKLKTVLSSETPRHVQELTAIIAILNTICTNVHAYCMKDLTKRIEKLINIFLSSTQYI